MQVKKFEARTMKEALEMVKKHLGPEAIILGARDNRKSFGLVGEGSVEITAAISDEVLQKKKFTESRMRPEEREKFQNSPAKMQKQVMENFVTKYNDDNKPARPTTRTRYIDIEEDQEQAQIIADQAQARIKSAAQRAWNAMHAHGGWQTETMDLDGFQETRLQPGFNGVNKKNKSSREQTARTPGQPVQNRTALQERREFQLQEQALEREEMQARHEQQRQRAQAVQENREVATARENQSGRESQAGRENQSKAFSREAGLNRDVQTARENMILRQAQQSQAGPGFETGGGLEMHGHRELVQSKQSEIIALKSELEGLKQVISQFQKVPQGLVTAHPGADFGLSYEFSSAFEKLTMSGVLPELAAEMLVIAQQQMPPVRFKNKALVDAWTARYILDSTQVVGEKKPAKVQILVGPSGSGKTASMIKLASRAAVNEGKRVVLLTADTFKVGASDQMRMYANILNTPFAIVRRQSDWAYLVNQLSAYDLILCDFPGMSLKALEEISTLRGLLPPDSIERDVHLVLPSTAKNQDLFEIGKRFKVTGFSDVLFTSLDESVQQGNVYNFMKNFDVPLHSFGTGARVPEDLEMATRERVLDLIFKLSKMKKAQE